MKGRAGTFLLFVVLCVTMGRAAMAQAPGDQASREQVLKLMTAMGVQQSVDQALHRSQTSIKDAARETFLKNTPNADEATRKKLDEILENEPFIKVDELIESVIPIYQKKLSAAEVQAGIDFYSSPSGKRLMEAVPEILREANETGGKIAEQKMDKYAEQLDRKLQVLQAEVKVGQSASKPEDSGAPKPEPKPEEKSK